MAAVEIEYAGGRGLAHVRGRAGVGDWGLLAVVIAAYVTAAYARLVMPGGYGWDGGWELANFLYNVAAGSASACFVVGAVTVARSGWRRCPWVVSVGTAAAGALPVAMLVLAGRWMQGNFA